MNAITGRRKAGYILGIIVGLLNIPGALVPGGETASGAPTGPPLAIRLFGLGAGIIIAVLLAMAWRNRSRALTRAAAVLMILTALTAVPAFSPPDIPAWIKLFAAVFILSTLASLVLLFSPTRRPVTVPNEKPRVDA